MNSEKIKNIIKSALKEDIGSEPLPARPPLAGKQQAGEDSRPGAGKKDITTETFIEDVTIKAAVISRKEGIIAGLDIAQTAFHLASKNIKFRKLAKDGDKVRKNQILAVLEGEAKKILTAERVALNFLSHLSGIATLTSEYVKKIKPYKCKILDTRKTTPLLREMEKYAVRMGGGHNHRMGLYDMVLIKDNHLKLIPRKEILKSIELAKRKIYPKTKIEIEVETLNELKTAYKCNADIIMLDNMSPSNLKKALKWLKQQKKFKKPLLEASGNINLSNVEEIAKTGVDFISVGKITNSAPALDMSLEIIKVNNG